MNYCKLSFNKNLETMQAELREECRTLNRGGCGVFAYLMGKKLKKEGVPFKIVIMLSRGECMEHKKLVLDNVRNNRGRYFLINKASFAHCFIKVGDLSFDGHFSNRELFDEFDDLYVNEENTYSLYDMFLAINLGGWNDSFDRDSEIPKIEKILSKYFN